MSDLIWVGNTLYPRGAVIAAPIVVIVAFLVIVLCLRAIASRYDGH